MATHWFDDPAFVRKVRRHLAMTQKRLAAETDLSRALVNAIEHGERRMTVRTRSKIWSALIEAEIEIKKLTLVPLPSVKRKMGNLNSLLLVGGPTPEEIAQELSAIERATNARELGSGTRV